MNALLSVFFLLFFIREVVEFKGIIHEKMKNFWMNGSSTVNGFVKC